MGVNIQVASRVPTAQGKQKFPVRENTGNLVGSSCKFPVSKGISIFVAKIPNADGRKNQGKHREFENEI